MENFNISENPEFSEELRKLSTTDKAHANVFNELFEKLLNNDVYLNKAGETAITKANVTHDTTEADAEKVPGADVTAELQEQIKADGLLNLVNKSGYAVSMSDLDANELKSSKLYMGKNVTNSPSTNDWYTMIPITDKWTGTQIWFGITGIHTNKMLIRTLAGNVWSDYRVVDEDFQNIILPEKGEHSSSVAGGYIKCGKLVTVNMYIVSNNINTVNGDYIVATGLPLANITGILSCEQYENSMIHMCRATTSGTIVVRAKSVVNNGTFLYLSGSYICK